MVYTFDASAFKKRKIPCLAILWGTSFLLDGLLAWHTSTTLSTTGLLIEDRNLVFIASIFLYLINAIFIKAFSLVGYYHEKRIREQSYVEIHNGSVFHLEKLSRKTCHLNGLYFLYPFNAKIKETISENRYKVKRIDQVTQDTQRNLHLKGLIEMQLIDKFLDQNPELDWNSDQIIEIDKHTIPPYYQDMAEIHLQLLKLISNQ